MTVDLPLRAYLETLATPPGAPGAESATAVAAALAAALVAMGIRAVGPVQEAEGRRRGERPGPEGELPALAGRVEEERRRFEQLAAAPGSVETLLQTAEGAARTIDLALQAYGRLPARPPAALAGLVGGIALARAAADAAVQVALVQLEQVGDPLERAAAKTRATGLAQRARRAEAEFLAAMATAGST